MCTHRHIAHIPHVKLDNIYNLTPNMTLYLRIERVYILCAFSRSVSTQHFIESTYTRPTQCAVVRFEAHLSFVCIIQSLES